MSNEPIFDALRKEYAKNRGIQYERLIAPIMAPAKPLWPTIPSVLDNAEWIRAKEASLSTSPFDQERRAAFKDAVGDPQKVADKSAPLEWPVPASIVEGPAVAPVDPVMAKRYVPVVGKTVATEPGEIVLDGFVFRDIEYTQPPTYKPLFEGDSTEE